MLETNKTLSNNAHALLERILEMQSAAEQQLRAARAIETKILDIEKAEKEHETQLENEKPEEDLKAAQLSQEMPVQTEQVAAINVNDKESETQILRQNSDVTEKQLHETQSSQQPIVEVKSDGNIKTDQPRQQINEKQDDSAENIQINEEDLPQQVKKPAQSVKPVESNETRIEQTERKQSESGAADKTKPRSQTTQAAKDKTQTFNAQTHGKSKKQRVQEENDRNRKNKKSVIKERVFSIDDDDFPRGSRKVRHKKQQVYKTQPEPIKIEKAVITEDTVSVKLLSEKIGKPVSEILKKLLLLGIMSTINSQIDFDTAQLVSSEFGVELEQKIEKTAEDILVEEAEDTPEDLITRPPVVTIMGHVDHGKTSLLDKIRTTHVTENEAGGITQHIGAYQVEMNGQKITFIDTPGHEAFTAMRARGAQVTDIAIIVVAADDGIMPQTEEAINHAKSADVPIIVAINKMDKDNANPQRVMQSLTEYDLLPEEWGGDTVVVPVSAKTGMGIDKLLEMILLVAEVLELKANPNRLAKGTIIEAQLDKGRGPVATVLVENGTLNTGDTIIAGTAYGRVRIMFNDVGEEVKAAGPSMPVEVIGFSEVPEAGDILRAAPADKLTKQVAEQRKDRQKAEMLKKVSQVSLDDLFSQIAEGQIKELNLVIKADVQGSVEAVRQSLEKLSNDEVRVKAIHTGVGAIAETDIMLAAAANAIVIGFNVRPDNMAQAAAEREKVDVRLYRVIYKAIEDITNAMNGMLDPEYEEKVLGHAEVRQLWRISSVGVVAGCYVTDGVLKRNSEARLLRDNVVIYEGKLSSLKRFKDDAKEVAQGYECGLSLENYNDIKEGDIVECFEMQEIKR